MWIILIFFIPVLISQYYFSKCLSEFKDEFRGLSIYKKQSLILNDDEITKNGINYRAKGCFWSLVGILGFTLLFFATPLIEYSETRYLIGTSENKAVDDLGRPNIEKIFVLSDSTLIEYRYGLADKFPDYSSRPIEVKELIWKEESEITAAWYTNQNGKWTCVDILRWDPREINY